MRYPYRCKNCGMEEVVNKPMKDASSPIECIVCGEQMVRVYAAPSTKTADGFKK